MTISALDRTALNRLRSRFAGEIILPDVRATRHHP
jgi:hypothetical protein